MVDASRRLGASIERSEVISGAFSFREPLLAAVPFVE